MIKILATILLSLSLAFSLAAQENPLDTFQTFSYEEGDTTYLMKQYFLCMLKTGPTRDQNKEAVEEIQAAHMAHLDKLAGEGKICMVGPMGDNGELRGIAIYNVTSLAEAVRLANEDPAVQAGRLTVELHPWWAAVGSKLF